MAKWEFILDLVTPCARVGKIPVELLCFALKLTGEKICVVVKSLLQAIVGQIKDWPRKKNVP